MSADTDFGTLLATTARASPSFVLLRRSMERRAVEIVDLLLINLPDVEDELTCGAIVVIDNDRPRIRRLPIR